MAGLKAIVVSVNGGPERLAKFTLPRIFVGSSDSSHIPLEGEGVFRMHGYFRTSHQGELLWAQRSSSVGPYSKPATLSPSQLRIGEHTLDVRVATEADAHLASWVEPTSQTGLLTLLRRTPFARDLELTSSESTLGVSTRTDQTEAGGVAILWGGFTVGLLGLAGLLAHGLGASFLSIASSGVIAFTAGVFVLGYAADRAAVLRNPWRTLRRTLVSGISGYRTGDRDEVLQIDGEQVSGSEMCMWIEQQNAQSGAGALFARHGRRVTKLAEGRGAIGRMVEFTEALGTELDVPVHKERRRRNPQKWAVVPGAISAVLAIALGLFVHGALLPLGAVAITTSLTAYELGELESCEHEAAQSDSESES